MTRALSHIKETIACRAFEHALHPNLVPQPTRQGADYGTDYLVNVFDEAGELDRTFAVQVKYVDESNVTWLTDEQRAVEEWNIVQPFPRGGPVCVRLRLQKRRLREYVDRRKTPAAMLLVAANRERLFHVWLPDLHDYWLRWIPGALDGDGTGTIVLNSIRVRWSAHRTPPMLILCERDGPGGQWLDSSSRPGTTDSLVNVAVSAFLEAAAAPRRFRDKVDAEGLWNAVMSREEEQPEVPLFFGKLFSLLSVGDGRARWAVEVLERWTDAFAVPLALYVLAAAPQADLVARAVERLRSIPQPRDPITEYLRLEIDAKSSDRFPHLEDDFIAASALFLARAVEVHRSGDAQSLLVTLFGDFPHSLSTPNLYARQLVRLARAGSLLEGASMKQLRGWCRVDASVDREDLAKAIGRTNSRWITEYRDSI